MARGVLIDTSSQVLTAGGRHSQRAPDRAEKLVLLLRSKDDSEIKYEAVEGSIKTLERLVGIQPTAITSILSLPELAVQGDSIVAETPLQLRHLDGIGKDIRRALLNESRTETLIVATLDQEPSPELLANIRSSLNEVRGAEYDILVGGDAAARAELSTAVITDLLVLGPLTALLLWLVLYSYYGSALLAGTILGESTASGIVTVGVMALLGEPITIMSVMLPVILLTSGIVDDMYFIDRVLRLATIDSVDFKSAIFRGARYTAKPVFLGSATAVAALLSLSWCGVPALESLARVGSVAVFVSFVATFSLMPAMLMLLPRSTMRATARRLSDRVGDRLVHRPGKQRALCIVGSAMILVVAGRLAASAIPINDSWIHNLPTGETRDLSNIADQQLAGGSIAEIQIAFKGISIWSPPAILELLRLADRVRGLPKVRSVWSPAEALVNLLATLAGRDAASQRSAWVEGREKLGDSQADQLASLLSSTRLPFMSPLQVRRADAAPLVVAIKDADAVALRTIVASLQPRPEDRVDTKLVLSDPIWRSLEIVDSLVRTSTSAVIDAIMLVTAVVLVVMRSWRLAVVAGLSVAIAIAVIYVCLWICGASLGIATALFAPLAVGFGANSVTHLIAEFDACPVGFSERMAYSQSHAMPASVAGSMAAILGFSALLLSRIPANQAMAVLIIGGLLTSAAAAVVTAPACLHMLYGRLR
ncbi:MMPL family transporter [Bradyrhizobium sp. HKCCYLS1011]|uniref:MMPL family transporter n=1 Tax=Bradyrhizobium sp. HKCCYLS1011 TaxID=3420733 RepID=UPI003EC0EC71